MSTKRSSHPRLTVETHSPRRNKGRAQILAALARGPQRRSDLILLDWVHDYELCRLAKEKIIVRVPGGKYELSPSGPLDSRADAPHADILAYLARPRRLHEVVAHFPYPRSTIRGRLDALVASGIVDKSEQGYEAAAVPASTLPPAAQTAPADVERSEGRRQPIRDAILAFLAQPRRAHEVAAHIGRPVSIATGHLGAMCRKALIERRGEGIYVRAGVVPAGATVDIPRKPQDAPLQQKILAFLSRERSLAEILRDLGVEKATAYTTLRRLRRKGLVRQVGKGRFALVGEGAMREALLPVPSAGERYGRHTTPIMAALNEVHTVPELVARTKFRREVVTNALWRLHLRGKVVRCAGDRHWRTDDPLRPHEAQAMTPRAQTPHADFLAALTSAQTPVEVAALLNIKSGTAERRLQKLAAAGKIKRVAPRVYALLQPSSGADGDQ